MRLSDVRYATFLCRTSEIGQSESRTSEIGQSEIEKKAAQKRAAFFLRDFNENSIFAD
jgi:hypothetical protein